MYLTDPCYKAQNGESHPGVSPPQKGTPMGMRIRQACCLIVATSLFSIACGGGGGGTGGSPTTPGETDPKESEVHRVLYLTNLERKTHDLPPLKGQANLDDAAHSHACDMAQHNYFSHTSQDGRDPGNRITAAGYTWNAYAENIAAGDDTPEAVMNSWKGSPGHLANINGVGSRELGVGYCYSSTSQYGSYWVQDFGARSGVYPVVIEDEAYSTSNRTVNLYVYGTDWATQMIISEASDFTGASWEAFSANPQIQLSEGAGLKHIYVSIKNSTGEVKTATDEIVLQ